MNDLYAQYKTEIDYEVLVFRGQLDQPAVRQLWQKILAKSIQGSKKVYVDMFGAGPVLAEGVFEMQDCWDTYSPILKSGVIFRNFNERAAQSFQMYGILFHNRQAIFKRSAISQAAKDASQPLGIMSCPSCRLRLRIWQNGPNACPSCGMRFQASY